MTDTGRPTFRVHKSGKGPSRGSKLLTGVFALVVLAVVGGGGWFYSDQEGLLRHVRERDRLAVPAVWVLQLKGIDAETEDLLKAALDEGDPSLRAASAAALGSLEDRDLVAYLGPAAVDDPDPSVREAAVTALGRVGSSNALGYVRAALEDEEPTVQVAACGAAAGLLLPELIPDLILRLEAPDYRVQVAAQSALEEFTEGELSFEQDGMAWEDWYREAY